MKVHSILFVKNQLESTKFYSAVFGLTPALNVPGMTEFHLNENFILGLMPIEGAQKILGEVINPSLPPKCELYFRHEHFQDYFNRALEYGATELSPISKRNWGDTAGYLKDSDGHVIAFSSL